MKKILSPILFLAFSITASAAPGQFHYVKTLQAEVRESASDSAKIKLVVAIGRKLVEFDQSGEYLWVGIDKSGGRDGWIKKSQIGPTDPDGIAY